MNTWSSLLSSFRFLYAHGSGRENVQRIIVYYCKVYCSLTPFFLTTLALYNLLSLSRSSRSILSSGFRSLSGSSLVLDHLGCLDIAVLVSCLDGSTVLNVRQEGRLGPLRRDLFEEQHPEPVGHVLGDVSRYRRLQVLLCG